VSLSPVTQRTEVLDVLRGFAIFGMFTVNMTADALWNDTFGELEPWSAGFLTKLFINLFTNGKFVTIFSFLFGVGFYIQSQNCISNNVSVERFWLKRLSGLFIIGITAIALTLPAGILVDYAIFGLGLLLFHRVAPRYMLIVVILSFLIAKQSGVIFTIFWPVDAGAAAADPHDAIHDAIDLAAAAGGFLELSRLSLLHTWVSYSAFEYYIGELDIFGLMLLGVYVGRIGATADEQVRTSLARKTAPWLVTIGFAGILVWIAMEMFGQRQLASLAKYIRANRSHGIDQLPVHLFRGRVCWLPVGSGAVRQNIPASRPAHRCGVIARSGLAQSIVVGPFQIWARGMAMAILDLWPGTAHATCQMRCSTWHP
jgi:uncharacterized protein